MAVGKCSSAAVFILGAANHSEHRDRVKEIIGPLLYFCNELNSFGGPNICVCSQKQLPEAGLSNGSEIVPDFDSVDRYSDSRSFRPEEIWHAVHDTAKVRLDQLPLLLHFYLHF